MKLNGFFRQNPKAALAFSGGVDSAYLLYAAVKYGANVRPYFVKSAFQPRFELKDARRLAQQLGVELIVLAEDRAARIVRLNFSLSVSNFVSLGGSPVAAREAFSLSSAACPFRFAQYSRSVMRFLLPCNKSI